MTRTYDVGSTVTVVAPGPWFLCEGVVLRREPRRLSEGDVYCVGMFAQPLGTVRQYFDTEELTAPEAEAVGVPA